MMTKRKSIFKYTGVRGAGGTKDKPRAYLVWAGDPEQCLGAIERKDPGMSNRFYAYPSVARTGFSMRPLSEDGHCRVFTGRDRAAIALVIHHNRTKTGRKRLDKGSITHYRTPR